MTEPDPNLDVRHPRLRMRGPSAELPLVEPGQSTADLPYAGSPRGKRWGNVAFVAIGVLILFGVVILVLGGGGGSSERTASEPPTSSRPAGDAAPAPTVARPGSTTEAPASTTTTTTTTTTTVAAPAPATVPTTAPAVTVPVDQLPPHEAVYRDGKLILQGTLPDAAVAERFRAEAAAVIGPDNVIEQYQFDPRVPSPTDGHVVVDEQFVFAKGSAAVDPAYLSVFDLGVAVLQLNPQATMRIRGYTDDRGPSELNQRLSRERAQAAADYLVSKGIDPARLTVEGLGPADPVAPNDTEEGRAQNRRIEVDLYNLLN